MIWIEKVKTMGSCALGGVERGRGSAEDRAILADVSNVGMFKRVHETASCQGHSSLDAPSELNPPQRIPSPLLIALLVPQAEG